MKEPACTDMSPAAINVVRGLGSAQKAVLSAMLWDLKASRDPEDGTDCLSVTGKPWRWHLVGDRLIEYRSLTRADKNAQCPKGGFFVNQVTVAKPEVLAYMQLKGEVA
jgi:hypothetical protein